MARLDVDGRSVDVQVDPGAPLRRVLRERLAPTGIALPRDEPKPTDADSGEAMTDICRCGTYDRVRAVIRLAADGGGKKVVRGAGDAKRGEPEPPGGRRFVPGGTAAAGAWRPACTCRSPRTGRLRTLCPHARCSSGRPPTRGRARLAVQGGTGTVRHERSGRPMRFGDVAAVAAKQPVPADVPPKDPRPVEAPAVRP